MSEIDRSGWVTVEYDGAAGAKAGVPVFRTKGLEFAPGKRVQLAPEAARLVVDSAPSGAMKVVSGKPADKVTTVSPADAAARRTVAGRAGVAELFRGAQAAPVEPAPPVKPNPVKDKA